MFDFQWVMASGLVFLEGLKMTGIVTCSAIMMGFVIGCGIAGLRLSRSRVTRWFAIFYINAFRMQALLVILFATYLITMGLLRRYGHYFDVALPSVILAFSLFESAYFAEIIRTGMLSLDPGQQLAGQALGYSPFKTYFYITLPQAVRASLPSIVNQCITVFHDSTLIYVVGLSDFFAASIHVGERDANTEGVIIFMAICYFLISYSLRKIAAKCCSKLTN